MAFLDRLKTAIKEAPARGDTARMPRGNITAIVKEIDVDNDQHGWLLEVEVTGGTNGVGETIKIAPTKKAIEYAEKGKLDQKIEVGSELIIQRVQFPERGSDVYSAQRVIGFVLNHDEDKKKGRTIFRRVPYRLNIFQNGYSLSVALPETKEEIADETALVKRIQADQKAGQQTLVVGRVNDAPFFAEAINGQFDREKGEFVPFDAESVADDVIKRISTVTRNAIEVAEKAGDDFVIEMNAYGIKNFSIAGTTKQVLEEQMEEKNRFSQIPVEAMFTRGLRTHVRTALSALDKDAKAITKAASDWVENNLSPDARKSYAQSGFAGMEVEDLVKFLEHIGIKAPRSPSSQAANWAEARAILAEGKRKRVATGWLIGDVVTQTLFDKKKKPVMEYPVRAMHYTASSTSAYPFFPDGKFLKERNDDFFGTVRDGFRAFINGEVAVKESKPDVAEATSDEAPSDDELNAAVNDLFGEDEDMSADAFPDEAEEKEE